MSGYALSPSYVPSSLPHSPLIRGEAAVARFWARVARCAHGEECAECCWLWIGSLNQHGYGRTRYVFRDGSQETYAHRVAWRLMCGTRFPEDEESCHKCNVRSCCNPAHIRAGTHAENIAERLPSPLVRRGESLPMAHD